MLSLPFFGPCMLSARTFSPNRAIELIFFGRTSEYRRTFFPLSISLWNILCDPVFVGVGLAGFKSSANTFLLA